MGVAEQVQREDRWRAPRREAGVARLVPQIPLRDHEGEQLAPRRAEDAGPRGPEPTASGVFLAQICAPTCPPTLGRLCRAKVGWLLTAPRGLPMQVLHLAEGPPAGTAAEDNAVQSRGGLGHKSCRTGQASISALDRRIVAVRPANRSARARRGLTSSSKAGYTSSDGAPTVRLGIDPGDARHRRGQVTMRRDLVAHATTASQLRGCCRARGAESRLNPRQPEALRSPTITCRSSSREGKGQV